MTEPTKEMNPTDKRPGRPLGLTLAILATSCLFSVMPMLQLGFDVLINQHLNSLALNMTMPFDPNGEPTESLFSGVEGNSVSDVQAVTLVGLGLIFLATAFMAWRGRPRWGRLLFSGAVLTLDVIYMLLLLSAILTPIDPSQGFDSSQDFVRSSYTVYLLSIILVTLYLLWYMNRAPARAFYRGYYLKAPIEAEEQNTDSMP